MKNTGLVLALIALHRLLLWLFPSSDGVWNYATFGLALVAVVLIVRGEWKANRSSAE